MDPITASCCNLKTNERDKTNEKYQQILGSCVTLSDYEEKNLKTLSPQIFAALLASSYHMILGISLAYSAILLPQLKDNPEFEVSQNDASWITSILALMTPVGSILVGFLMDRYGRLNTLRMSSIPGIAGWVLIALSQNVPMMIAGRGIAGFTCALGSNPAIVYLTEIARKDMRGSLISFAPALTSLGMVLTFIFGWFTTWRNVAWICTVLSLLPLIVTIFIPESPPWLVSKNRIDEARKSLTWLNKYQPQLQNRTVSLAEMQLAQLQREHELKLIEDSRREEGEIMTKIRGFLKPTGYKPLLVLTGMFTLQQFSGIFIFLFYSITFFQEVGSSFNPYLASIFIGILRFIMSMINTYLQKTVGRRPATILSSVLMSFFILVTAISTNWNKNGGTVTWLPVVTLLLFVISSMIGMIPIPYTMAAEVFPLEIRGVAHSTALCICSIIMFFSLQFYPLLLETVGGIVGLLYFFSVVCLLAAVYAFVFLPETHRKKLSEIEDYFKENFVFLGQKVKDKQAKGGKKKNIVKDLPEIKELIEA